MKKKGIKEFFRNNWKVMALTAVLIPVTMPFFVNAPAFVCGIAVVPIMNFIHKMWTIPPILSRLVAIALFACLVCISWYAAEIVVVLAAYGMAVELLSLIEIISKKIKKVKNFVIAAEVIRKTHSEPLLVI